MPGRLNPRKYDLGELRDAVQEMSGRRESEEFPQDEGRPPVRTEQSMPIDTSPEEADAQPSNQLTVREAEDASAADVESYLRSRHRLRRDSGEQNPDQRTSSNKAQLDHSTGQRPQNPETFLAEISGPQLTKPYLERLPDAYSAQLEIFEWLDEMLATAGHEGTVSSLEYYESIGWLSGQSRDELEEIADGLSTPDVMDRRLDIDDHRVSLIYIARLSQRLPT